MRGEINMHFLFQLEVSSKTNQLIDTSSSTKRKNIFGMNTCIHKNTFVAWSLCENEWTIFFSHRFDDSFMTNELKFSPFSLKNYQETRINSTSTYISLLQCNQFVSSCSTSPSSCVCYYDDAYYYWWYFFALFCEWMMSFMNTCASMTSIRGVVAWWIKTFFFCIMTLTFWTTHIYVVISPPFFMRLLLLRVYYYF